MKKLLFSWSCFYCVILSQLSCKAEKTADKLEDPALTSETSAKLEITGNAVFDEVYLPDSVDKTISLTSKADYDLTNFTIGALSPPFSIKSNDCPESLGTGGTCTVILTFSPTEVDEYGATLGISYLDGELKVNRTVDLTGTAISPGQLSLNSTELDIGLEVTNAKSAEIMKFQYSGTQDISEFQISFEGKTNYTEGSFPGARGNCGVLISGPCRLDIEFDFSTETTGLIEKELTYSLNNGKETISDLKIPYKGLLAETNQTISKALRKDSLTSFHKTLSISGKLFALDQTNSRILVWSGLPVELTPPEIILGQDRDYGRSPNRGSRNSNASTLNHPGDFDSDGTHFIVADTNNHRLLIWKQTPTQHFQRADIVIGQIDFKSNLSNQGTSEISSTTMSFPNAVKIVGTKLLVSDKGNQRVLIWNQLPTADNQPADLVLGQSDFTTNAANFGLENTNASGFHGPGQITATDSQIFIIDENNYRTLVFPVDISSNGQPASYVIGQTDLTTKALATTPDNKSFNFPCGILVLNDKVYISDFGWHRVLRFQLPIDANYKEADATYGQTDFANSTLGTGLEGLHSPCHIATVDSKILISDTGNFRISIWPSIEASAADSLVGQADTTVRGPFQINQASASTVEPTIYGHGSKIVVADAGLNRIQIWNDSSSIFSQDADILIGQASVSESVSLVGPQNLSSPSSATINDSLLLIADTGNNRILVFDNLSSLNATDASLVIGQADLYSNASGTTANTLASPDSACLTGTNAFVADSGNNRILRYPLPLSTGINADLVLGQPDMVTGAANVPDEDPAMFGLNQPTGIYCDDSQLIIVDRANHRVAYWKPLPESSSAVPTFIIDNWNPVEGFSTQANYFNLPRQAIIHNESLYVADTGHNRVLKWDTLPTEKTAPSAVIGQKNNIVPSLSDHFQGPGSIAFQGETVFLGELKNQRILKLPTTIFSP